MGKKQQGETERHEAKASERLTHRQEKGETIGEERAGRAKKKRLSRKRRNKRKAEVKELTDEESE